MTFKKVEKKLAGIKSNLKSGLVCFFFKIGRIMERSLRSRKKICLAKNNKTAEECSTNSNSTSEILNDDCLFHIFEYLPIRDRIRLARVSKRWCAISQMPWKSLKILNFTSDLWGHGTIINRKAMRDVLSRCGEGLTVWDMSNISVLFSERIYLASFLKFCPNLTSIDLTSIDIGVPEIRSLVENCKNIVVLKLGAITSSVPVWFTNGTILSTYTNLQVLCIQSVHVFGPYTHIGSLSGGWIQFKDKNSVKELYLEHCTGLEKSNIFTAIPELPNLHTFSLQGSLQDWNAPRDIDFIARSDIRILDISSNFISVDDNLLKDISYVFKRLTSLYIGNNSLLSDLGLKAAISSSNLEHLNIDRLTINGSSLSCLPKLKQLSCQSCHLLNDERLQSLFNNSERLESIDLRGAVHVGNIIKKAITSIKLRTNDVPLVICHDDYDIVDMLEIAVDVPDNLKLIQFKYEEE